MAPEGVMILSYENLSDYTDNFNEENCIGFFQFGKFYRGKIKTLGDESVVEHDVMVKIWQIPEIYRYWPGDNEARLMDEILLLSHYMMVNHPGIVKLYGYCYEEENHLGAVYQFKPKDSIYNLIPKGEFPWLRRIQVAIRVASLLEFLHTERTPFIPFRVRNLDCAHIVLEEDYNPKLCDFGMITGGIFPDRSVHEIESRIGCHGYLDFSAYGKAPYYEDKKDVYAFGAILVSLISKYVYTREMCCAGDEPTAGDWAVEKYYDFEYPSSDKSKKLRLLEKPKFSLVHEDLESDPHFDQEDAYEVTSLGIQCVEGRCYDRPTMKEVLESLLRLKVVKKHGLLGGNMEESPMVMD